MDRDVMAEFEAFLAKEEAKKKVVPKGWDKIEGGLEEEEFICTCPDCMGKRYS